MRRSLASRVFTQKNITLYLFLLPAVIYYALFHYRPMYGFLIAFQDFNPFKGMNDSPWVGLKHFRSFFESVYFLRLLRNTVLISAYSLFFGFPMPIVFALMLGELKNARFRTAVQTISYLPHFVSTVILGGLIVQFLSPNTGVISILIERVTGSPNNLLENQSYFRTIYIASGIWQGMGWSSIIYFSALTSINPSLYEAADIDGASRIGKMIHISLPGLAPTIITLLILNLGNILKVGFEKAFLLQRNSTLETADIISTYVYRSGLINQQFSFGTAVDLFNSVIGLAMVLTCNRIAKAVSGYALW